MTTLTDQYNLETGISASAKIFGYFMIIVGLFFAYVYMFNPGLAFPGIEMKTVSEQFGLYSTGGRVIGSLVGILIALLLDNAALLALMLVTRVVTELGDVIAGLVIHKGSADTNTFALTILAAVEFYFIVRLMKSMAKTA